MGSVMMEENVVSAAGTTYRLSEREICRLVPRRGVGARRSATSITTCCAATRRANPNSPDLRPVEAPPVRDVRKIDKQFIGAAPGLDDGADRSVKLQLPILGDR
jgi:hypothetical protein